MVEVSIVIPVYNEEKYLARCIDSLLKQSFKDFEIIFVDDGSTDHSLQVIEGYIKKDSRIKLLKQIHGGPGKARNLGAKNAKGEILVFVDADMIFDKNYIRDLINPIINNEIDGTSHKYEYIANKENLWARSWSINRVHENVGKWIGIFRAVKKDLFIKSGGFDPTKGYFDDDLSKIGKALMVNAICYHNNPETLKEAFTHSLWVGNSFFKNKRSLKNHIKLYSNYLLFASLILILGITTSLYYSMPLINYLLLVIISIVIVLEGFTFKRFIKEKDWNYLYSIPILMFVRFSGYLVGFIKGAKNGN